MVLVSCNVANTIDNAKTFPGFSHTDYRDNVIDRKQRIALPTVPQDVLSATFKTVYLL